MTAWSSPSTRDLAAACGIFYDAVMDGTARVRPSLVLNQAAVTARRRHVGQMWVWSRVDGGSPLVAASLASVAVAPFDGGTVGFAGLDGVLMGWLGSVLDRMAGVPGSPIDSPRATLRTATDGRDVLFNSPDGWEVDNPFLWWTNGDGTYGNPLTSGDPTGWSNLAAVTRCTSIICDSIAGMPWRVTRGEYERLKTPPWLADPQVTRLDGRVVDPSTMLDTRLGPVEFWSNWICAALWFGNGYVYAPTRDAAGAPQPPLWQLHPSKVRVEDGAYWVDDVALPSGSVLHLRGMLPYWNSVRAGV